MGHLECTLQKLEPSFNVTSNLNTASQLTVRCTDNNPASSEDASFYEESILRTNHFGVLPRLRRLSIEGCKIRKIPFHAFSGLPNLEELNIHTRNSEWASVVMEVEAEAFKGLNKLKRLNLTNNNLWTMPQSAFCHLHSLTSLNLSQNYLQDVSDLGFGSRELRACRLPVQVLDLSGNAFSKLPERAFGQLGKLRVLGLASNNLNVMEDSA